MTIEGQGHFFTIYFPGFVCFVPTRPRYQVSVYRTIGPLVFIQVMMTCMIARRSSKFGQIRPPTAELAAIERLEKIQ